MGSVASLLRGVQRQIKQLKSLPMSLSVSETILHRVKSSKVRWRDVHPSFVHSFSWIMAFTTSRPRANVDLTKHSILSRYVQCL